MTSFCTHAHPDVHAHTNTHISITVEPKFTVF